MQYYSHYSVRKLYIVFSQKASFFVIARRFLRNDFYTNAYSLHEDPIRYTERAIGYTENPISYTETAIRYTAE